MVVTVLSEGPANSGTEIVPRRWHRLPHEPFQMTPTKWSFSMFRFSATIRNLFSRKLKTSKRVPSRRKPIRPMLELLEGRDVPSTFVPGSIQGQDGWSGGSGAIASQVDQAVVQTGSDAHFGAGAWHVSNDTTYGNWNGDFQGWVFSPGLSVAAGQPSSLAGADRFSATYYFRSANTVADGSNIEVDLGDTTGNDRLTYMTITNRADADGGLQLRMWEPNSADPTIDFPIQVVATNIDRGVWHRIDIQATFVDGQANDTFQVSLDGVPMKNLNPDSANVGTSNWGTFEAYDAAQTPPFYLQTNRLFFRSGNPPSSFGSFSDTGAQGFYIDDVSYKDWNSSAPGTTLASYTATFETAPSTVYVNASWAGDSVGVDPDGSGPATGFGYDAFATIQDGVNAVAAGGTVYVAAGTYTENVVVNKPVTLDGAQAGVDARTRGTVPETIVTNGDGDFQIEADNVTIDGFTLTGVVNDPSSISTSLGAAIWTNPGFSGTHGGLQALNNIIRGNIAGIELDNDGTYQTKVQYNLFENNDQPGAGSGLAIETNFGLSNALIDNNAFTNTAFVESSWALGIEASSDHVIFSNNSVTNQGRGVFFSETNNATITNNTFTGASHYAIGLFGFGGTPNSAFSISGNTIDVHGSGGLGISVQDSTPGDAYSGTLTLSSDNITTSGSDVSIDDASTTAIDATGEKFNGVLASGASTAQLFAIEDTVIDAIDVSGFGLVRLKAGQVYVAHSSELANAGAVQRGIDAALAGDIVNLQAGTYVANGSYTLSGPTVGAAGKEVAELNINKPLTLLGPNPTYDPSSGLAPANDQAIIIPGASDPNPNDPNAVIVLLISSSNVTVQGITVDGSNLNLAHYSDPGTHSYVTAINSAAPIDAAELIASYAKVGNVTLQNNILRNAGYNAVDFKNGTDYTPGATTGSVISRNLIQSVSDAYRYGDGISLNNDFYADVTENVIQNVRTGVQVGNYHLANPNADATKFANVSNNTISADKIGLWYNLFYQSSSPFTFANNSISALPLATNSKWSGVYIHSVQDSSSGTFQGNTIDGTNAYPSALSDGYDVWDTSTTGQLLISGGSVTGVDYGVWVNTYEGYNSAAHNTQVTVSGLDITASQIGVYVEASAQNTTGATATATMESTTITTAGSGVGLKVSGATASATVTDSSITGNATGIDVEGSSLTARNNFITGNSGAAILVGSTGTPSVTVQDNDLSNNGSTVVQNNNGSSTVDAAEDYWGSAYGTPAAVAGLVSGQVNFESILTSGDADGSTPGFQSDTTKLAVDVSAPTTSLTAGSLYTLNLAPSNPTANGATITQWVIHWGDGSPDMTVSSPSGVTSVTHTYAKNGNYTITAVATDELGYTAQTSVGPVSVADGTLVLAPIPDQSTPINQPLNVTLPGSDADGDPLTYGFQLPSQVAYNLKQSLGLHVDPSGIWQNYLGQNERWLRGGTLDQPGPWYYILPNGQFFAWNVTPHTDTGTLVATLTPTFWTPPALLWNAAPTATASLGGPLHNILTITPSTGFVGTIEVTATVTDGFTTASQSFHVTVQDPMLPNLSNVSLSSGQNTLTVPTGATDPDGDTLSSSYQAGTRAYLLQQAYGLHLDPDGLFLNYGGAQEKWLRGGTVAQPGPWYFILPNGQVYLYDHTPGAATGTLLATLDPTFYAHPELVYNAQPGDVTLLAQLGQGFTVSPDGLYDNCFGQNEKWLQGPTNQFNNSWYFLLPNGQMFAWDGSASASGTPLAGSLASPFSVKSSAGTPNAVEIDRLPDFVGTFDVLVTVTDSQGHATRQFFTVVAN
jgi:hypothetical protein